jgi:hypothetical protein
MPRRSLAGLIFGTMLLSSIAYADEKGFRSVEMLKREGVKRCAPRHLAITEFIHDSDNFAYFNQWNRNEPDKHVVATLTTRSYEDGTGVSFMATTPTVQGGCDVTFTHVFYARESCGKLRDTTFKEWKYYSELGGRSMYEDPTAQSVKVTLLPIDTACMVVKTGTLFFSPPRAEVNDTHR